MREWGGVDEVRREKERRCGEKKKSREVELRSRGVEEEEGKEGVRREDERTVEKRRGGAEG